MREDRIWHKVWPQGVPRTITVEKPFTEYLRDRAAERPEATAMDYYGREISYRELDESIDRFAWGLIDLGLQKGDRVALYLQNCPQFVIGYFGTLRAGGVVVSLNPMYKHTELEPILKDIGVDLIVTMGDLYPQVAKLRQALAVKTVILTRLADYVPEKPVLPLPPGVMEEQADFPDTLNFLEVMGRGKPRPICRIEEPDKDLATLQLTGGTTGVPKAAMNSVYALTMAMLGTVAWFRQTADDVHLGVTPFFHVMGMQITMAPALISGGKLVILSRFTPDAAAQALEHYKISIWVAAITMITALVNLPGVEKYDFSSLRTIVTGGSPVSLQLQQQMKKLAPGSELGEGYGMTETTAQGAAITPFGRWKPGFVGIPFLSDMKIVDLETGQKEMGLNEEGEIIIKGPTIMEGYWNNPEETGKTLRDGWLYTGDIGLMDEEGYVKLVGRRKEMIICSGFNVFPNEVEHIMVKHPAVFEVAVVGVPDAYRGESPKAFVALKTAHRGKVSEQDIIDWCKDNMASYKRPREVEFRESLPKSAVGKILKRALK